MNSESLRAVLSPQLIGCVTWGNASYALSLSFFTYGIGIIKLSLSHKVTVKGHWIEN